MNYKKILRAFLKSSMLGIALSFMAVPARAQYYVKTFNSTLNGTYTATDVIDMTDATNANDAYTVVLQSAATRLGGASDNIILKKLDMNGNIVFDVAYEEHNGNALYPTKVIHTVNDEYIVVGYCAQSGANVPFAARFDQNGMPMWLYTYAAGVAAPGWKSRVGKMVITQVQDDPGEDYIIAGSIGGNGSLVDVNAIRIHANGHPMWNYTYPITVTWAYTYDVGITTIAYGYQGDLGSRYLIAGTEDFYYLTSGYTPGVPCYMTIDKYGAVVDPFSGGSVVRWAENVRALFDAGNSRWNLSYTMRDNTLAGTTTHSQAALLRLDMSGLHSYGSTYYWIPGSTQNYTYGFCEDLTHNYFLLSVSSEDASGTSMSIYRIDKGLTWPATPYSSVWAYRYNPGVNSFAATSVVASMDNSGLEHHLVAGFGPYDASHARELRVVNADGNDNACGGEMVQLNWDYQQSGGGPATVTPITNWLDYNGLGLDAQTILSSATDCADAPDPRYYKQKPTITATNETLRVYPSLLQATEYTITMEVPANDGQQLQATVLTMDGKKIREQSFSLQAGSNKFQWSLDGLQPGNYFISLRSANGDISNTSRISKL